MVNNSKLLFFKKIFVLALFFSWGVHTRAETDVDECYLSGIHYSDEPNMTHEERIEAMNQAFFESVNRFEECMLSKSTSSTSSSSASAASSSVSGDTLTGTEVTEENALSESADVSSAASSELSGTETEPVYTQPADIAEESEIMEHELNSDKAVVMNKPQGSGAVPEDIPQADNDDVIAAQIRLAAEMETNPEKKAKLWNEYRKYKGLPVKNDE